MNGKIISGPTAVFLIALFFLPWILVSCEGMPIGEFSGYQLAVGTPPPELEPLITAADMESEPILFAVPLAGVITLVLLAVTIGHTDFEQNATWGQLIVAFAAILILLLEWLQWNQQSITPRPALWGSFISLLILEAAAILDLVQGHQGKANQQQIAHPTPPKRATPYYPSAKASRSAADDFFVVDEKGAETILDTDGGLHTEVTDEFSQERFVVKTEVLSFNNGMVAWLVFEESNRQFEIRTIASIGRLPDNDIVIDDSAMSSYHARIQEENGRFHILDLNSTNGVYIAKAGQTRWQKQTSCQLQEGDKIKLGRAILRFTASAPIQ